MVSLQLQFVTFVNMILVGFILGVIFDIYRVLRGKINPKKIITDVFDLLFSLLTTFIIFFTLIYSNGGIVRIYIFLGVILGQIIYYWFLSKFVIKIFVKIFDSIYYLYSKVKKAILIIYNRLKLVIIKTQKWLMKKLNRP